MRQRLHFLSVPILLTPLSYTGLCPVESQSQETQSKDITDIMNAMGSEVMNMLVETFNREGGAGELLKIITSSVTETKEN